ncbi:hypothetical protein AN963_28740 [Brevibacillus choshinensis]|uniref:Uncharacterized protein n=1 Tax=Brevibacillus choshinensis TaxID=54911 RepID=A0ABR5MZB5_BRECH|nr:hypothetical protein [Brevibacillus choshinensis]KQL43445.1 hypothetical protein AN963_28740 [Brevibacillus choshinensis]
MNKLARDHTVTNEQVLREMNHVRQDLLEMKNTLGRMNTRPSGGKRRGSFLFGARSPFSAPREVEKAKPAFALEDLLPLLPHLSGAIPQLKNPKVAESIKVLSNPAVMSIIQQFVANGGLSMLTNKQAETASKRERRGLFR